MRIVALADTHLYHDDLGRLPDGDVLVHAGDMLRFGTLDELESFVEWFLDQPQRTKIVVAGNHDRCFETDRSRAETMLGSAVHYLQDRGLELSGLKWWGSPWQPAYRDWAFNLPRGEPLRRRWAQVPHDVDVLVTHAAPEGTGDRSPMRDRLGCADLRERVEQLRPLLHVFGHIHEDGGLWRRGSTTSANVTTWEGERGATVLDLDPSEREVIPIVVPSPLI